MSLGPVSGDRMAAGKPCGRRNALLSMHCIHSVANTSPCTLTDEMNELAGHSPLWFIATFATDFRMHFSAISSLPKSPSPRLSYREH